MNNKDYPEIILQAIDQVVTKRLEGISYDVTDTVTIINADEAKNGKYKVSNGSATYYAYSSDTTYEEDDVVYMTVPNGDYTQQKIIIGKYVAENDKPYVYESPFQTIVDVSGNVIQDVVKTTGLVANNPGDEKEFKLWEKDFEATNNTFTGYTRLGLQAQFRSWLAEMDCARGEYGLKLNLYTLNNITVSEEKAYTQAIDAIENYADKSQLKTYLTTTLNFVIEDNFWEKTQEEQLAIFQANYNSLKYNTYTLYFTPNDMYGDPYGYTSFFQQEKVFDISSLGTVVKCDLWFYEAPGTFFDKNGKSLEYADDLGGLLLPNLFVKDPYICFGYDVDSFSDETIMIFTNSGKTYSSKTTSTSDTKSYAELVAEQNKKVISLRWFHDSKAYTTMLEGCEVRWYRYALGAPSADEYSGVYWTKIAENSFDCVFIPDVSKAQEQIKAVLIYDGTAVTSNILTFTNDEEVVSDATKEFVAGLNIWCADGSYGNYYIYDPGNKILEQFRTTEAHKIIAMFSAEDALLEQESTAAYLTEAEEITWTFNTESTMIQVNNIDYTYKYNNLTIVAPSDWGDNKAPTKEENGIYTYALSDGSKVVYDSNEKIVSITRYGNANNGYAVNAEQYYFVKENYSSSSWNNVIQCRIKKNGREYYTSKRLMFGQAGTTGTDATLRLYFDPASQQALYSQDGGSTLKVRAVLYDSQNQEVDLNDETDFHGKITWSWYVSDVVSWKEQEVTTTTGEKKTETVQVITEKLDAVTIKPYSYTNTSSSTDYNLRIKKSVISSDAKEEDKYNYYKSNNRNIVILNTDKKLDMNTFLILEATLKGWGNYDLTVRKPIPIQVPSIKKTDSEGNEETYKLSYVDCADEIIYSTAGYPSYYKEAWKLHLKDDENNNMSMDEVASTTWSTFHTDEYSGTFSDKYILKPLGVYVKNALQYGAQVKLSDGTVLWTQPIYQCSNNYPSSTLNQWDGKSLTMNEKNGSILATAISAGKKNSDDNTFSGVMLGDWKTIGGTSTDISIQTGVYGFDHGLMSYAFKEDGTAFIGKSGMGRIMFDGTSSTIQSEQYRLGEGGMLINLKDGIIKMSEDGTDKSNRVTIDVTAPTYPLMIGTGNEEKFKVQWDGSIEATNGTFSGTITGTEIYGGCIYIPNKTNPVFSVDTTGKVTATSGEIGGFKITSSTLYSTKWIKGTKKNGQVTIETLNSTGTIENCGIYMNSSGEFSLGNKFQFKNGFLYIASNIYRYDATGGTSGAYYLIGVNDYNRLQIGSSAGTYEGMSIYGGDGSIYLIPDGGNKVEDAILRIGSNIHDGDDDINSSYKIKCYATAEQQKGFYARFA